VIAFNILKMEMLTISFSVTIPLYTSL